MREDIRSGLAAAAALPVGRTEVDFGAYLRNSAGTTTAGGYGEVSSHLMDNLSAFARGSFGVVHTNQRTDFSAEAILGIKGYF